MSSPFTLIQQVAQRLPIPLVGSVMYNGNKVTKTCTMACYTAFRECFELISPTRILEIGTHAGGSACMMLAMAPAASVVSVDIGENWITPGRSFRDWYIESDEGGLLYVEQVLKESFGADRFNLIIGDSTAPATRARLEALNAQQSFDLGFVDGNHALDYVEKDIAMCRALGIRTLILDDYNSDTNGEVAQAAANQGLELIKEWKSIHSGGVSFALTRVP